LEKFGVHHRNFLPRTIASIVDGGTSSRYPDSRNRVYRLANACCLFAIVVTLGFMLAIARLSNPVPMRITWVAIAVYSVSLALIRSHRQTIGRCLLQIGAATTAFLSACYAGPDAWLQAMLFPIAACSLLLFDTDEWEPAIAVAIYPIALFVGLYVLDYSLPYVPRYAGPSVTPHLRILSIVGPVTIIAAVITYFKFQLQAHQLQIDRYIARLHEEHHLQIHAHKMASLGEMAAGMAHEINTPLTTISLRTGRLKQSLQELEMTPEKRGELVSHIDRIVDTTYRVARIINSLRSFSHLDRGDGFEPADAADIVSETLDLCSERISAAGIRLESEVESGLSLECRSSEVSQVLLNLLNNSVDAMEGMPAGRPRRIRVVARAVEGMIHFEVSNSGPAIPESVAKRLFEPFFTTKRKGKGTGLGLNISATLIRKHRGRLTWVPNAPETTFRIELPIVQPSAGVADVLLPSREMAESDSSA
jgi:signal transduction histidine kinase